MGVVPFDAKKQLDLFDKPKKKSKRIRNADYPCYCTKSGENDIYKITFPEDTAKRLIDAVGETVDISIDPSGVIVVCPGGKYNITRRGGKRQASSRYEISCTKLFKKVDFENNFKKFNGNYLFLRPLIITQAAFFEPMDGDCDGC